MSRASQVPRQIDQPDTYRQRGDPEDAQMLISQLGQFLCHAANKGRGQRIGQPLHNKHKSDGQKEGTHWPSPFDQFAGTAGSAAGAASPEVAALPAAGAAAFEALPLPVAELSAFAPAALLK